MKEGKKQRERERRREKEAQKEYDFYVIEIELRDSFVRRDLSVIKNTIRHSALRSPIVIQRSKIITRFKDISNTFLTRLYRTCSVYPFSSRSSEKQKNIARV